MRDEGALQEGVEVGIKDRTTVVFKNEIMMYLSRTRIQESDAMPLKLGPSWHMLISRA